MTWNIMPCQKIIHALYFRKATFIFQKIFILDLFLLVCFISSAEASTPPSLPAVKVLDAPTIDGRLNEPVWRAAPKATNFWDALLDTPVEDDTIAFLIYDDQYIYVAFYAYDEEPDLIIGREAKSGVPFQGEDYVAFIIDTFHTHQLADRSSFMVNPLGTLYQRPGGGRASKREWEGQCRMAAQIVSDGWTVELAIPWQALNYTSFANKPLTMGINFERYQNRTKVPSFWANIGPQKFYEKEGHWVGVVPPKKPLAFELLPFFYGGIKKESENFLTQTQLGLATKISLTSNLTGVVTINPDFANVEQEVETVDFSYQERFYPDRRPFFQEGSEVFRGNTLFYSRRIPKIDFGAKIYGTVGRTTLGILDCFTVTGRNNLVLSLQQPIMKTSSIQIHGVERWDKDGRNIAWHFRPSFRWKEIFLRSSADGSSTSGEGGEGWRGSFSIGRNGKRIKFSSHVFAMSPGFQATDALIRDEDYRGYTINLGYRTEWREGSLSNASVGLFHSIYDRYDGRQYRGNSGIWTVMQTRKDYRFRLSVNRGYFYQYRDWTAQFSLGGKIQDRFRQYGVSFALGQRQDAPYRFLDCYFSLKLMERFSIRIIGEFLWHQERKYQGGWTFNYDFTPQTGVGGRIVWRGSRPNLYITIHRSGDAGMETFLIFGDPNAETFQPRFVAKILLPL